MNELILDRAISKPMRLRIGSTASFKIRLLENGAPSPIPDEVYELYLKPVTDLELPAKTISLVEGSGIAIGTGENAHEFTIDISSANSSKLKPVRYHWQFVNKTRKETWLNGITTPHLGNFNAGAPVDMEVNLNLGEIIINVNLTIIKLVPSNAVSSDDGVIITTDDGMTIVNDD